MLASEVDILDRNQPKTVEILWHQSSPPAQVLHENLVKELGAYGSFNRHVCRIELGMILDKVSFLEFSQLPFCQKSKRSDLNSASRIFFFTMLKYSEKLGQKSA